MNFLIISQLQTSFTFFTFICICCLINDIDCAVAASHSHNHLNKERIQDGVYSARDTHHYTDDGGHNDEFDHEAIVGSHKEAEEFHQLSPEESKERLAILIKKMDSNSDQFVDRHELKAWILRSFRRLTEEEGSERFEDVDHNGDSQVTWKEYLKDTYDMEDEQGLRDPFQSPHAEEEDKLIADDRRMFDAADANNDGALSSSEFVVFFSPEEHAHMLPIILEQTLKDKDKNNDGRINFQEFIGDSAENHDKEWLLTEKEKFDSDYDKDGDGLLNGNEILSWIVPSNDEVATDEVEHLFVSADDDHDNRLSYQEILDNYDTFVGSEVTDYGDHLQNIHHFNDEL